jgi:hypothetical protein
MIIKHKLFLWICSYSGQPVLCWHHFSPAVLVPSSGSCRFEPLRVVRFHRLEAYQVRLSRYLVMRCAILKAQASPLFLAWDDPRSEDGVL